MRELLQKIISTTATCLMFILSIIWMKNDPTEIEPQITAFGLMITLTLQLIGWKPKGKTYLLYAPRDHVTQAVPRLFDFSKDKCKIVINAENTRREYWRIGFKMRKTSQVGIHPALQNGYMLFSIEQTNDQIELALHGEDSQPIFNHHTVITNYENEMNIVLKVSREFGVIKFSAFLNGVHLDSYTISNDYRYARLISWGDNNFYKLNVEIKNWHLFFYL